MPPKPLERKPDPPLVLGDAPEEVVPGEVVAGDDVVTGDVGPEVDDAPPRLDSTDVTPARLDIVDVVRPDVKPPKPDEDDDEVGVYVKVVPPCMFMPLLVSKVVTGNVYVVPLFTTARCLS